MEDKSKEKESRDGPDGVEFEGYVGNRNKGGFRISFWYRRHLKHTYGVSDEWIDGKLEFFTVSGFVILEADAGREKGDDKPRNDHRCNDSMCDADGDPAMCVHVPPPVKCKRHFDVTKKINYSEPETPGCYWCMVEKSPPKAVVEESEESEDSIDEGQCQKCGKEASLNGGLCGNCFEKEEAEDGWEKARDGLIKAERILDDARHDMVEADAEMQGHTTPSPRVVVCPACGVDVEPDDSGSCPLCGAGVME